MRKARDMPRVLKESTEHTLAEMHWLSYKKAGRVCVHVHECMY